MVLDGVILEKPVDKQEAITMLSSLVDKSHTVFSGVVLLSCSRKGQPVKMHTFYEATTVTMGPVGHESILGWFPASSFLK